MKALSASIIVLAATLLIVFGYFPAGNTLMIRREVIYLGYGIGAIGILCWGKLLFDKENS